MEPRANQTTERSKSAPVGRPIPIKALAVAVVCTFTLVICGCGKTKFPSYYTLSIAAAPPALKPGPVSNHQPATVAVRRFETPSYIRQGRIVYRESPNQIGFYEYHRWAVDPGITVTTAVIESLRSAGIFSSVGPYDGQSRPDYLLTGRLQQLDEIDYGGGVKVEAKLSAELLNVRTGAVVWTGEAAGNSKVDGRNVSSVVAEMSRALQGCIDQLLTSMEQQIGRSETSSR
jgi:ABC-type uncharacterized transport system auxiliary subunit